MSRIIPLLSAFCILTAATSVFSWDLRIKADSLDPAAVKTPVNIFDTLAFNKHASRWLRPANWVVPTAGMIVYGIYLWDWDFGKSDSYHWQVQPFWGDHAEAGGADKCGHMYSNYMITRFLIFMFRATGSSQNAAVLQGALSNDLSSFIGELGDGFSKNYGFDPWDFAANHMGILLAAALEYWPALDHVFAMRWEYFPTRHMKANFGKFSRWDISTDYNAGKFIFSAKLGGIPYLSQTPLRYVNFDVGYYSRGYKHPEDYPSRTRNVQIGLSVNYSIAFGDILPTGYVSSSLQTFFNFFHPWCDVELKRVTISDRPHS